MYTNVSDADTTRAGEYRQSPSPRTSGLTQTMNGGWQMAGRRDWWWWAAMAVPPGAAAPTPAAVGTATTNSEWQVGGRWAWTQARANKVKQAGQRKWQDWCEQWTAYGSSSGTSTGSSRGSSGSGPKVTAANSKWPMAVAAGATPVAMATAAAAAASLFLFYFYTWVSMSSSGYSPLFFVNRTLW